MPSRETPSKSSDDTKANDKSEEEDVDFESGIDSWVIDKEDSNGSCVSFLTNSRESHMSSTKEDKKMDKENIKHSASEKNPLRCFRLRKSSSNLEFPHIDYESCGETCTPSAAPSTNLHLHLKDKESLSSEEISIILREMDKNFDCDGENRRVRLNSIENLTKIDMNETSESNSKFANCLELTCNFCNSVFISLDELKSHERKHRQNISSCNTESLSKHQRKSKDSTSTFQLDDSNNSIQSSVQGKNGLKKLATLKNDSSVKQYPRTFFKKLRCSKCTHYSTDPLAHKVHNILFHSENRNVLSCEYCDYQTTLCANLATHITIHYQLKCPHPLCNYNCASKDAFDSHLLTSHGLKKTFKCPKCDYTCNHLKKFKNHALTHQVSLKYPCKNCDLQFATQQTLKVHLKTHKSRSTQLKCKDCNEVFSKKHLFKQHKKSHSNIFICDTCNNKFSKKNALIVHMKVHAVQTFKCEECNEKFEQQNCLKLHMRSHKLLLSCKYCSFQTKSSKLLSKHACLNQLYDIQERALNFLHNDRNEPVRNSSDAQKLKTDLNTNKVSKRTKGLERNLAEIENKTNHEINEEKSNEKLKSLRQNLPSRLSQEFSKTTTKSPLMSKGSRTCSSLSYKSPIIPPMERESNKNLKANVETTSKKVQLISKESTKNRRKSKKYSLSVGSTAVKMLLRQKYNVKELLLEPVTFAQTSYLQCYYQSQPIWIRNHISVHLRQNPLLSCLFCSYKTNSSHLLKQHSMKIHAWNSALVNNLFR